MPVPSSRQIPQAAISRRPVRRRVAAVMFGLALLAAAECGLRVAGVAQPSPVDDPFVGFAAVHPLFVLSDDGRRYETAPQRRGFFAEDAFLSAKPPTGQRIFVIGGSTVQGRPFSIATSFTQFLEQALNALEPTRHWEVVNCGGISYASYRLVPILRECLTHDPDLIIICTGHNEFLEDVSLPEQKRANPWLTRGFAFLQQLRIFRGLHHLIQGPGIQDDADSRRAVLPEEADALLDHQGGLEAYERDPARAARTADHYRSNLERMIQITRRAGIPLLLIQPPINLTDCPPFKSVFSAGVTAAERKQVGALLRSAGQLSRSDRESAVTSLRKALDIDPAYALTWYQLGQVLQTQGRTDEAREAFLEAIDQDVCPLRMTTPLRRALRDVADQHAIPLLNAQQLMAAQATDGLVGGNRLVDHIHPSFQGHQDIATAILKWMADEQLVATLPHDWEATCRALWKAAVRELDNLYFLRGQRALKDLQGWAAGRAEGPPLPRDPADHNSSREP